MQTPKEYLESYLYWNYDGRYFVKKLREKLTDEQVVHVLEILDNTCKECWGTLPCQCWNDE
jgi:hypothetical protein